jgi:hypothetical protein
VAFLDSAWSHVGKRHALVRLITGELVMVAEANLLNCDYEEDWAMGYNRML